MTEPDASLGFGMPRDLVVDAVRKLHAVRQRSALALLGIVIGTAAVIAMITIGENAKSHALAQFQAMGVDLLAIQLDSNPSGRPPPFTPGDAVRIGGYGYTVVGVLNKVVPNPLLPVDLNSAALIPLPGLRRVICADKPRPRRPASPPRARSWPSRSNEVGPTRRAWRSLSLPTPRPRSAS